MNNTFFMNDGNGLVIPQNQLLTELRQQKEEEEAAKRLEEIKAKQKEIDEKIDRLQVVPLYTNVMILPYKENPYVNTITKGGVIIGDGGSFKNPDSGEQDTLHAAFVCGRVIEVGPDCKYAKRGDDVFYGSNGARPVPFMNMGFWMISEQNIMVVINEDMKERFKHLE